MRYAARMAIENQPVQDWWKRAVEDDNAARRIQGVVALARQGMPSHQYAALKALTSISFTDLSEAEKLNIIRAYGLIFIRLGEPADHWRMKISEELMAGYPSDSFNLNKELAQLLGYLEAPGYVDKTLALLEKASEEKMDVPILSEELTARHERYGGDIEDMKANMPSAPEIAYAFALSNVKDGWTLEARERYLNCFMIRWREVEDEVM